MLKKIILLVLLTFTLNAKEVLNFAVTTNVGPLNPHLYSPNQMFGQNMVYEGLVKYNSEDKLVPWLAKSWEISKDQKTYTFFLRKDVLFSNGEKFNAKVAKANFDAVLSNKEKHSWLELVNIIKDVKIKDEYTIQVNVTHPYEPIIRELSLVRPFRFIALEGMKEGNTKDGIKKAIGTGPYVLTDTKLGISDTFERNKYYHGKKPAYEIIHTKVIPDPNTKVIALKTNEVDLILGNGQISLDSFNELKKDFNTYISKALFTTCLALNSKKFPTNDLSVRKALNMAFDKDKVINKIFYNTVKKADFLFSKKLPSTNINANAYEYNIKKANEILEKDGWLLKDGVRYKEGKALKVELVFEGTSTSQKSIAEILQASMKKIGVIVELNAQKSERLSKLQKSGVFNLIFNSTWGAPYDPISFLSAMRQPSHADFQAQSGLKDKKEIDATISKILSTLDKNKRDDMIKKVLKRLHDKAIYLPIFYQTNKAVANKKVSGIKMDSIESNIRFWDFYPSKK